METPRAAPAVQAAGSSAAGGEDSPRPARSRSGPILHGMRRSCDSCGRKKRKCDGERPACRRCVRAGEDCVYRKRMCHLPVAQQQQHMASSTVMRRDSMLPFKRCSLSPSPATGLVGMQENAFLCDFFGCVGFLPLTTKSHIRETMVKIMLAPVSRRQADLGVAGGGAGQADAVAIGMESGNINPLGGKELPMNSSTCMFWCAVALGALVKGSPFESVASYTQQAEDALQNSQSGSADAQVAAAWTTLAFLHNFTGNSAKFQEYLELSGNVLTAWIDRGSTDMLPVGFVEKVQRRNGKPSCCDSTAYGFCSQVPQLNTGEHELFRHVMRSFLDFEHATVSNLTESSSAADQEPEPESPGGAAAPAVGEGQDGGEGNGDQPEESDFSELVAISDALASAWTQRNATEFEHLEEELRRSGMGASMAASMVNGFLAFKAAGRGDVHNALERLDRAVEVFAQYPGLCRSIMGAHEAHELLAALAAMDHPRAQDMFATLRAIYNPFRAHGMSPVPPLEECRGMSSICDSPYCSAIGRVIASDKMRAFPGRAVVDADDIDGDQGVGGYDRDHSSFAGEFAASPEMLLMMPAESGEALVHDFEDHDLTSADWLEVTHAMLDAGNESGQPG
eukprot:g7906.t1